MLKIKSFVFSPIQENTYLLYNEFNDCIIIDPGCYFPGEHDELKAFITQSKLTPRMLLNTHCHLDHVFGNKFVAETYGLTLHLHEKEKMLLDYAPTSGLMYNMPFDNYAGDYHFLKEADVVKLGNDELAVIEAPGHSPGHICFYCAKQHFIISGDVLFNRSIGRTDLPGGNHQTLLKNIREKLFVLPEETVVYSGHGPETTIGEEKKYNPFLN
ncbi:MAG TPA: MBL fold metallo-hydrolase [Ferruginibacter sp.]|nr:MBL fold metallo-hydrolase [Chitinophagaceae bacterium]MBK9532756.1 MBL fold metallo-hydrolase [Chitinophagaceae bacterium]HQW91531.1 MBL fold metallo-hydrolase [Ferruginibacter sp.]